ncbi:MAG: hypothetical protein JWM99_1294 [Verrucomicrobiales bacterium]|nr:hypothetical protein [Verrucomicrobiales bacterium]
MFKIRSGCSHNPTVKTLAEIQAEISTFSRDEFWKLAEWFDAERNRRWDQEMAADAKSGKLVRLAQQARQEFAEGKTRPLEELLEIF